MSTWEERMAARAAARGARRAAAQAEIDARYPDDSPRWPGHEGHHEHVEGNMFICCCRDPQTIGVFTVGMDDPRFWSDDPAEQAQAERETADFRAWLECHICGEKGVQAGDTFGVWPPQTLPLKTAATRRGP